MANNDNRWEWPKVEDLITGIHQNKQSQLITDSQRKSSKTTIDIAETKKENKETSNLEEFTRSNRKESKDIEETKISTKESLEVKETENKSFKENQNIFSEQKLSHKSSFEIENDYIKSSKNQEEIQSDIISNTKEDSIVKENYNRQNKIDSNIVQKETSSIKKENFILDSISHRTKADIESEQIKSDINKIEKETESVSVIKYSKKTESNIPNTTSEKKEENEIDSTKSQKKTEIESEVDKTHFSKRENALKIETPLKGRTSTEINFKSVVSNKQEIESQQPNIDSIKQENSLDETRRVLHKIENELSVQNKTKEKEENLLQNIFSTLTKEENDISLKTKRKNKEENDVESTKQTKKTESSIFENILSKNKTEEEISDKKEQTEKIETEIKNTNASEKEEVTITNKNVTSQKDELKVMKPIENIFKSEEKINTNIDSSLKTEKEVDINIKDSNKEIAEENTKSVVGIEDSNFSIKTNVIFPIDSPISSQLTENNYITTSRLRNKDKADSETEGNLNYNIIVEQGRNIIESGSNKIVSSKYETLIDNKEQIFISNETSTKNYNYNQIITPMSSVESEIGYNKDSDFRNKIKSSPFLSTVNDNRPTQSQNNANYSTIEIGKDRNNILGDFNEIKKPKDRGIIGDFNDIILPTDKNVIESGYIASQKLRNKIESSLADSMINSENKLFTESLDKNYQYYSIIRSNESNPIITPITTNSIQYSQYEEYSITKEDRNKLKANQESFSILLNRDLKTFYKNNEISSNKLKENNLEYTSEIKHVSPKDGYEFEGLIGANYIDKPVGLESQIIDYKSIPGDITPDRNNIYNLSAQIKISNRNISNRYSILDNISTEKYQLSNNNIYDARFIYNYKLYEDFDSTLTNVDNSHIKYIYEPKEGNGLKVNTPTKIISSLIYSKGQQQNTFYDYAIEINNPENRTNNDIVKDSRLSGSTEIPNNYLNKQEISRIFNSTQTKLFVANVFENKDDNRFIGVSNYVDVDKIIFNHTSDVDFNELNKKQFKVNYDYTAINKPYLYHVKSWQINFKDESTDYNGFKYGLTDEKYNPPKYQTYTDIIVRDDNTKNRKSWAISSGENRVETSGYDYFDALRNITNYNNGNLLNVIGNNDEDVYQQNKKIDYLKLLVEKADSSLDKDSTHVWTGKEWILIENGTEMISPNSSAKFSDISWRNRDSFDLTDEQLKSGKYQQINHLIDYNIQRQRISKIYNTKTQSGPLIDASNYIYLNLNENYTQPIFSYDINTSDLINNPINVINNTNSLTQSFVNYDYKSIIIKADNSIKPWSSHDLLYNAIRPSYDFDTELSGNDIKQNVINVSKSESVSIKQQNSNFTYSINDSTLPKEWFVSGSSEKIENPSYNLTYYYDKTVDQRPSTSTQIVSTISDLTKQQASNFIYSQPVHSKVKNYFSEYDNLTTTDIDESKIDETFIDNSTINYINTPTRIEKSNSIETSGGHQQRINFTYNEHVDFSRSKKKFNEFQIEPYYQSTPTRWNSGIVSTIASSHLLPGEYLSVKEYNELSQDDKNKYQLIRTYNDDRYYLIPSIDPIYTHVIDATKNLINYSTVVDVGTNIESTEDDTTYIISTEKNKYVIKTSDIINQENINFNYESGFYDHIVSRKAGETANNINQGTIMSIFSSDAAMDGITSSIAIIPAISNLIYPDDRKDIREPVWNANPLKIINDGIRVVRDTISDGISKQPKIVANVTNVDANNKRTDINAFSVHTPRDISFNATQDVLKRWRQSNRPRYIFKGNDIGSNIMNAVMVYLIPGAVNNISSMFFGTNPWLNEILKSTIGTLSHLDNWNQIKNLLDNRLSFEGLGIDTSSIDNVMNDFSKQIRNDSSGSDIFDFNNAMLKRAMRFLNSELPRMLATSAQNNSYENEGTLLLNNQYTLGAQANNSYYKTKGHINNIGGALGIHNVGSIETSVAQTFASFSDYIKAIKKNFASSTISPIQETFASGKKGFIYKNEDSQQNIVNSTSEQEILNKLNSDYFTKLDKIVEDQYSRSENKYKLKMKDDFRNRELIKSSVLSYLSPSIYDIENNNIQVKYNINELREKYLDIEYNKNFDAHDPSKYNKITYSIPKVKDDYIIRTANKYITDKETDDKVKQNNSFYTFTPVIRNSELKAIDNSEINQTIKSENINLLNRTLYADWTYLGAPSTLDISLIRYNTKNNDRIIKKQKVTIARKLTNNKEDLIQDMPIEELDDDSLGGKFLGYSLETYVVDDKEILNDFDKNYTHVTVGNDSGSIDTRFINKGEFADNPFMYDRDIYRSSLESKIINSDGSISYNYSHEDDKIPLYSKIDTKYYGDYVLIGSQEEPKQTNKWSTKYIDSLLLNQLRNREKSLNEITYSDKNSETEININDSFINSIISYVKFSEEDNSKLRYGYLPLVSNPTIRVDGKDTIVASVPQKPSTLQYVQGENLDKLSEAKYGTNFWKISNIDVLKDWRATNSTSSNKIDITTYSNSVDQDNSLKNSLLNIGTSFDDNGKIKPEGAILTNNSNVIFNQSDTSPISTIFGIDASFYNRYNYIGITGKNEGIGKLQLDDENNNIEFGIKKLASPMILKVENGDTVLYNSKVELDSSNSLNSTTRKSLGSENKKTDDGITFDGTKNFYIMSNKYKNFIMSSEDENYDLTGCGYIYGVIHVMNNGAANAYRASNGQTSRLVIPFQFDADISANDRQSNWNTVGAFGRSSDWFIWSGSSSKQTTLKTSYAIVSPDKDINTTFGSNIKDNKIENYNVGNKNYDYMKYFTERYVLSLLAKYEALLVPMQAGYSPPILKIRRGPMEWSWSRKGGYHETAWICTDLSIDQRSNEVGFTFSRTPRLFDISLTLKETLLSWDDFASGWGLTQEGGSEDMNAPNDSLQNYPQGQGLGNYAPTASGVNKNYTGKGNSFPGLVSSRLKDTVTIKNPKLNR